MSEVRLVDANELIRQFEIDKACTNFLDYNTKAAYTDCIRTVKCAETIDAEPIRHGRWTHKYYPTVWYDSGEPPEWVCSLCDDRAYNTYDYCPNCGAKMDEEK